jgi:hypothetical protein
MPHHKQLSDAEIIELLGDPPPMHPLDPLLDQDSLLRERFLDSVKGWLVCEVSLAEVQKELLTPKTHPSFRSEFDAFASAATEGHEAWQFCSPQSDWNRLAGRSGFALVKDGRVTHAIVTMLS